VLSLTGSPAGLRALAGSGLPAALVRALGDGGPGGVGPTAAKALVNLAAAGPAAGALLDARAVPACLDALRDSEYGPGKRFVAMLLANLCAAAPGAAHAVLAAGASPGLALRRLVAAAVAPVAVPPGARYDDDDGYGDADGAPGGGGGGDGDGPAGDGAPAGAVVAAGSAAWDPMEHAALVVAHVAGVDEGRAILLEPERRILPALFPLLASPSRVRRRGGAGALRAVAAERSAAGVAYLLSPSVGLVPALAGPLVGPDAGQFDADDRAAMNPALLKGGATRAYEPDAATRRALVEALLLLAGTRAGRDALRRERVYPVVKAFHEWLEGPAADARRRRRRARAGDAGEPGADEAADEDEPLPPDDEAAVVAINALVQQLFRDDEYVWPSDAAAAAARRAGVGAGGKAGGGGGGARAAGALSAGGGVGSSADATYSKDAVLSRMARFATVPLASARAAARAVATGAAAGGAVTDDELRALRTRVPAWEENDFELPPEWRAAPGEPAGPGAPPAPAAAGPSEPPPS